MICDFTYYSPTKVVFGKGRERETGVLVKERGAQKVLILYGGKSAQKSGLLFRVTDSLEQAGCLRRCYPQSPFVLCPDGHPKSQGRGH